jgi:hypothetical protein
VREEVAAEWLGMDIVGSFEIAKDDDADTGRGISEGDVMFEKLSVPPLFPLS